MMATLAVDSRSTGPVATPEVARAVIDPKSYAAWDPLLDRFDTIRAETPVLRIESEDDSFEPFWLVTRYDDVMRISKDNAGFLNAPRPTVLTSKAGEALAQGFWRGFRKCRGSQEGRQMREVLTEIWVIAGKCYSFKCLYYQTDDRVDRFTYAQASEIA